MGSRVLPLPNQAMVCEQACMVLRAHGPWLPDRGPSMKPGDAIATCVGKLLWAHAPVAGAPSCCSTAPSSSVHAPTPQGACHLDAPEVAMGGGSLYYVPVSSLSK